MTSGFRTAAESNGQPIESSHLLTRGDSRMRIAIVAPGAVGGYFGVLLARSGENVGALARGAHLDTIAEHGLIAEGPRGTFSARLDASDDAAKLGEADIVLFAVKLY